MRPTITPPSPEAGHAAESKGETGPESNGAMQDNERISPVRGDGKGAAAEGGGGEEQRQEEKDKGQGQNPPLAVDSPPSSPVKKKHKHNTRGAGARVYRI